MKTDNTDYKNWLSTSFENLVKRFWKLLTASISHRRWCGSWGCVWCCPEWWPKALVGKQDPAEPQPGSSAHGQSGANCSSDKAVKHSLFSLPRHSVSLKTLVCVSCRGTRRLGSKLCWRDARWFSFYMG